MVPMNLVIQGKNIEITDAIRDYVNTKIHKAVDPFNQLITEVDVHLSVAKNPRISGGHIAEVTVYANGTVVRSEEASESLYASLDVVADKLQRQLRKYKERVKAKAREKTAAAVSDTSENSGHLENNKTAQLPKEVVRMKYFAMAPLSIEEASERLGLVGHDFFVFRNKDTNQINVVYERNHGGFGVIVPRD